MGLINWFKKEVAQEVETKPIKQKKGIKENPSLSASAKKTPQPYEPPSGIVSSDTLAMDSMPYSHANQYFGNNLFANTDYEFLGYPMLASFSQGPEYRAVVSTLSEEHTRKWIKLQAKGQDDKTDKISKLEQAMTRYKLREVVKKAIECDYFFGRGQIYIECKTPAGALASDNDDELKQPLILSPEKIKQGALVAFRVVEPFWTFPWEYQATNPLADNYYEPRGWFVMGKKVHASRMITIISRPVPDLMKPVYNFGGVPLVQMLQPYVNSFLRTRDSISNLVHSFSLSVLKTDLQAELMVGAPAGTGSQMDARASLFNLYRDNRGLMMINSETEELSQINTPLSGLDALQAQAQEQIASIPGIPLIKLLGVQPSGLNASSEGEIRVFYDKIKASQQDNVRPVVKKALDVIQLSEFGEIDPDIDFEFLPLYELDEVQKETVQKTKADTDAVYIQAGVLDATEARGRLAGDADSPYHGLNVDDAPDMEDGVEGGFKDMFSTLGGSKDE